MRIRKHLSMVGGGGSTAFGLSVDPDCHVYLIDTGDDLILVDCGTGDDESFAAIIGNVESEGFDPSRISTLLLTHYHVDHAGGAARFAAALGVRVVAAAAAVKALESADESAAGLEIAKRAGLYRPDYRMQPVSIDRAVSDGERLPAGNVVFEVVETPGHCDGHVSYLVHAPAGTDLLAGDAVFQGGKVVLQNIHDCSIPRSAATVERLAKTTFDGLFPGHGGIVLSNGPRHAELAHRAFERLTVPNQLG